VFPVDLVGVWLPRAVVRTRIEQRLDAMWEAGLVDEVERLVADPGGWSRSARQAIGYKEVLDTLGDGAADPATARDAAVRRTRAFARRQRMWFRRDRRVTWLGTTENSCDLLPALLARWCP
jgi:tRNA dimethylallyltransferase